MSEFKAKLTINVEDWKPIVTLGRYMLCNWTGQNVFDYYQNWEGKICTLFLKFQRQIFDIVSQASSLTLMNVWGN